MGRRTRRLPWRSRKFESGSTHTKLSNLVFRYIRTDLKVTELMPSRVVSPLNFVRRDESDGFDTRWCRYSNPVHKQRFVVQNYSLSSTNCIDMTKILREEA